MCLWRLGHSSRFALEAIFEYPSEIWRNTIRSQSCARLWDRKLNVGKLVAAVVACLLPFNGAVADTKSNSGVLMLNSTYALPNEPFSDSKTHAATFGYRFDRALEIGVQQTVNYAGIADAEDIWDREEIWRGRTSGFANLDLRDAGGGFVPFVGAFAGFDYDARDASAFMGPHAGFSQYLDRSTFFRLRYRYEWSVDDLEQHDIAGPADQGEHIVSLGLGVNF